MDTIISTATLVLVLLTFLYTTRNFTDPLDAIDRSANLLVKAEEIGDQDLRVKVIDFAEGRLSKELAAVDPVRRSFEKLAPVYFIFTILLLVSILMARLVLGEEARNYLIVIALSGALLLTMTVFGGHFFVYIVYSFWYDVKNRLRSKGKLAFRRNKNPLVDNGVRQGKSGQ